MPELGSRISYGGHTGTVRFLGPVAPAPGVWLGIEWDDPSRGKHDGSKDGIRYFTCFRVPGAGSFLRPSASICHGKSFLEALKSKYIEQLHGGQSQETVLLGSSQGTIQVEAVNLDKIRSKLSKLSALREVSFDGEMVAVSDSPGAIGETCPNIRGLDLSKSLIHSWTTVAAITKELPHLQSLSLNQNRLLPAHEPQKLDGCFNSLTELRLNNTLMAWPDIVAVIEVMPKLQDLEIGHNNFTDADLDNDGFYPQQASLQTVKFNSNRISNWTHVCMTLSAYPSLERVILADNQIERIPFPEVQQAWSQLRHLSMSFNRLLLWRDICALAAWAPLLESLALIGNPIMTDYPNNARPLAIARLATLKILDGAAISAKERRDAELYYLTYIVGRGPNSEEERCQEHPRWQELCSSLSSPLFEILHP
ncbi:hypothetical protein AGABI2DRAFT_63759 [Agaricus bisporus var. bisporus H97]|uniref:hypothetical protein n=1 Tax=Agaricus bisporus var. bisporus (strain H97 / ATCC MYA-4626 / FGSC 10389) TaxID=936046 RepID=UPI00029F6D74|nr:hypothetical protein AGABI2DRAFT_63759 [Agaricus bisporus var. bisporus H97]EKV49957.1 hypothetical protein AGABI2DRAFT_63759 [Agaricus bisporus var. bisporus H97]